MAKPKRSQAKGARNFFHVMPLINDPAGVKWTLAADKKTQARLNFTGIHYFKSLKDARVDARTIAKQYRPSEVLYHRHPKKGENPHLFPINARDTYEADPPQIPGARAKKGKR